MTFLIIVIHHTKSLVGGGTSAHAWRSCTGALLRTSIHETICVVCVMLSRYSRRACEWHDIISWRKAVTDHYIVCKQSQIYIVYTHRQRHFSSQFKAQVLWFLKAASVIKTQMLEKPCCFDFTQPILSL